MDEQRLVRALRRGPPFATGYVPSSIALEDAPVARPLFSVGRLALVIAITALLLAGLLAGLVAVGARHDVLPVANGWIAFVRSGPTDPGGREEHDIYLVREGEAGHRVVGSDTDRTEQLCPMFSPDGRRLAHGEADGTADTGYQGAALVISDIDAAGNASEVLRIAVGGTYPPPCAAWSADGRMVAFGVPLTSPTNPERSAAGSQVWVASVEDGRVDVLADLLATDLEWSPVSSELAIASGQTDLVRGETLRDGSIRLYDAPSGEMRILVGPSGVGSLSWSPDGSRIAYQRGSSDGAGMDQEIWVIGVDGSRNHRIASGFGSIRGIGPVWSPTGDRIVYQRMKGAGTEAHDVVLVTPDGEREVVLPDLRLPGDDPSISRRPDSVNWSPDGRELLYVVWISGRPGSALIARPVELGSDPVDLQEDPVRGENRSWGRLPDR